MNLDTLWMPKVALMVLALSGGCGTDSEKDSSGQGPDEGGEPDAQSVPEGDGRLGQTEGTAHAGDAGTQTEGITIDDERLESVALDFCRSAFSCDQGQARQVFKDEADCRAEVTAFWRDDLELLGEACGDAQLDLHACYASSGCDEDVCTSEAQRRDAACPWIE